MKKGFTLIELLGVIVILALLVTLVFPSIINYIKKSSNETDDLTLDLIYNAADLYITNHINDFPKIEGNKYVIALTELVGEGYLTSPIKLSESDSDVTKLKCVQVLYNGEYKYELKNSGTCEEVKKLCTAVSGTGKNIGDEISCVGENFYVISNDETNVEMLAKYNLDVGNINSSGVTSSIANPSGIQKQVAKGYVDDESIWYGGTMFSSEAYWYDSSTSIYKVDANYTAAGRSKPYVYMDNGSTIHSYVKDYVTYLENKGIDVTGNLLSYEQSKKLGCSDATADKDGNCSSAPSFVYSTSYWLGSAEGSKIYMIGTTKTIGTRDHKSENNVHYGVRPVITMSVNYIK